MGECFLLHNETGGDTLIPSSQIDWSEDTDNASYLYIGDILIQWGYVSTLKATSSTTVTLPKPFNDSAYALTFNPTFNEQGQSFWWAFSTSKTSTGFSARAGFKGYNSTGGGSHSGTFEVTWMAIGKRAYS